MKDDPARSDGLWTLPNALCTFRFVGSFALLPISLAGLSSVFVVAYIALITTDLVDGPIARKLNQRSNLGAHLDSVADATLNACLLAGAAILCWEDLRNALMLVGAVVVSYGGSLAFGFVKFGRLISYHTYIAKLTQWLAMFAALSLVLEWSSLPLRVACIAAIVGNLETIAITAVLEKCQTDVLSLFRVWPKR